MGLPELPTAFVRRPSWQAFFLYFTFRSLFFPVVFGIFPSTFSFSLFSGPVKSLLCLMKLERTLKEMLEMLLFELPPESREHS